jgi:hypothetical protein
MAIKSLQGHFCRKPIKSCGKRYFSKISLARTAEESLGSGLSAKYFSDLQKGLKPRKLTFALVPN